MILIALEIDVDAITSDAVSRGIYDLFTLYADAATDNGVITVRIDGTNYDLWFADGWQLERCESSATPQADDA